MSSALSKPKRRILEAALNLFNDQGYRNVTTARIAEAAGMSEGNLWYHYRTRRELVRALWSRLEESALARMQMGSSPETVLDDLVAYNRLSYREVWRFRLLYRDRIEPGILDAEAVTAVERFHDLGRRQLEGFVRDMIVAGHFKGADEDVGPLVTNVWIVVRYWLDFLQETRVVRSIEPEHVHAGLLQQLALFRPYLTEGARQYLEEACRFVLDDCGEGETSVSIG
jgi:AcrR family transcriptional regulator